MYMNTKTRMNVYLDDTQREKLAELHKETGAPVAEHVRRAVDNYLEKHGKGKDATKGKKQE
ncbi:ribbon-helix-helix domain-containing protein [Pseudoduganella danionis]|uniref:Ribbon-helix-helix domain-containing protein n=2 Tax=Pseudoduganella danionis TaxID=1890295 RepID=A0ABW9SXC0_9BURK|nr:ribbon-helix-helix domain-containing protein [Pseudoduganella danionis]